MRFIAYNKNPDNNTLLKHGSVQPKGDRKDAEGNRHALTAAYVSQHEGDRERGFAQCLGKQGISPFPSSTSPPPPTAPDDSLDAAPVRPVAALVRRELWRVVQHLSLANDELVQGELVHDLIIIPG